MKRFSRLILTAIFCVTCLFSTAGCRNVILQRIINNSTPATSVDAAKMTNDITTDKIHALFTVIATNSKGWWSRSQLRSQGSAVAFYQSDGYCYLITNCHVAQERLGYKVSYVVRDYAGNEHDAYLFKSTTREYSAISADYDLAVLYFRTSVTYTTLSVAASDPAVGETVVALGAPENQSNAITFGTVKSYVTESLDAEEYLSNVSFPVILHDAYIDNGSSGGPLINANYEIVGINYGGSEDNSISLAVPATKVREFLTEYVYG